MYCEKCGAKSEDNCLFCESCGAKIEAEVSNAPVQNEVPVQAAVPPPLVPSVTAAPKHPMPKGLIALLVEIVILILLVVAFFQIGTRHFSPETVAKNYFIAEINGEWNKIYAMMDLPDSKMLTADMFLRSMENNHLKDIANYEVSAVKGTMQSDDSMIRTFVCKYMPKGGSYTETEDLQLVKQQNKKWLFFDEWKVSPSNNLIENYKITIPADSNALLNGLPLDELAEKMPENDKSLKSYLLPKAFSGKYYLTVQAPYRQEYNAEITLNGSTYISNLDMDVNIMETVSGLCSDTLQQLFISAANNADYDSLCTTLNNNVIEGFDCQQLYENIATRFIERDDTSHQAIWQSVNMKQMDCQYNGTGYRDEGNLYMRTSITLTYDYSGYDRTVDWWTGDVKKNPFHKTDYTTNINVLLILVDGQWKLAEIN